MRSVTKNGRSIFLTAVLAIILVYLFSIVGFLFFKDDFLMEVDHHPSLSTLKSTWSSAQGCVVSVLQVIIMCQREAGHTLRIICVKASRFVLLGVHAFTYGRFTAAIDVYSIYVRVLVYVNTHGRVAALRWLRIC